MDPSPPSDTAETLVDGRPGGTPPGPAPERIGAYRIEGRLGLGGMGEVLLAWDERLERRVAIKRIRQEAGLTPEQRERFRLEARLAARLSHSAVVQIYDLVSAGAEDAIVMEYVEGRTLADRLAAGERMETVEVLRLAGEIAEGLAAAHEAGLIHRDLKAANVLVTPSGHAKILDFGLARPVNREAGDPGITRQGMVLGTCHAMSPEQARGEEVDERSDLFSFGALIHEMLTGRPPFRGNDAIDSLRRVVTEEPVDPLLARPDLPAEAAHLLRRLLAKRREDRPANAREVIGVLESLRTPSGSQAALLERSAGGFSSGAETQVEPPAPFRGKAPPRTRRLPLIAALLLLVAAALALAARREQLPSSFDVRDEDYFAWMEIQKRIDRGDEQPQPQDLAQIESIVQRSPSFLRAQILGARIARGLFAAKKDPADRERAYAFIQEAKSLAPRSPLPLYEELNFFRATHNTAGAQAVFAELERMLPNARLLKPRAVVAEIQGDLGRAAEQAAELVERAPTWQNRLLLAGFEIRRVRVGEARRQLEAILQEDQGNDWANEKLAWLELMYGDPARAERLYEKLYISAPERSLDNVGTARVLRDDLAGAKSAFTLALEANDKRPTALANLAAVEWDLGHRSEAKDLYSRALEQLKNSAAGLSLYERLLEAQCLARLDRPDEAIEIARALESKVVGDPELLYRRALVYTLAGDLSAARVDALASFAKGRPQRWFETSTFRWLLPEIRSQAASPPSD